MVHHLPEKLSVIYGAAVISAYAITNFIISFVLKVKIFFLPQISSLTLYIKSISLGMISVVYYFLGFGILLIAQHLYNDSVTAIAYMGLKFYVIYKGVLRVIHQAFVRDMLSEEVCFKIDQLSSLAGLFFISSILIFPSSFIGFFFGRQFEDQKIFFSILAFAGFIYSLFLSTTTKSLLEKKDKTYFRVMILSVCSALVLLLILSSIRKEIEGIAISLLLGEIAFTLGLIKLSLSPSQVVKRIIFLLKNFIFVLIPLSARFLLNDSMFVFIISYFLFASLLFFSHYKKFKSIT